MFEESYLLHYDVLIHVFKGIFVNFKKMTLIYLPSEVD